MNVDIFGNIFSSGEYSVWWSSFSHLYQARRHLRDRRQLVWGDDDDEHVFSDTVNHVSLFFLINHLSLEKCIGQKLYARGRSVRGVWTGPQPHFPHFLEPPWMGNILRKTRLKWASFIFSWCETISVQTKYHQLQWTEKLMLIKSTDTNNTGWTKFCQNRLLTFRDSLN